MQTTARSDLLRSKFTLFSIAFGAVQIIIFAWHTSQQKKLIDMQESVLYNTFKNAVPWGREFKVVLDYHDHARDDVQQIDANDVTLVTQCSVNNLQYLPVLAKRWGGRMSVAIFTPHDDAIQAVLGVRWLRHCYPKLFGTLTKFHFVFPIKHKPRPRQHSITDELLQNRSMHRSYTHAFDCRTAMLVLSQIKGVNYMAENIPYPHNTLRNVAKRSIDTKFIFVVDVDITPSLNIREEFLTFYENYENKDKTVFVTPAFEVKSGIDAPLTKIELIEYYKVENVRPFHLETCVWCHKPTRFSDWIDIEEADNYGVAFEGEWEPSWEPFYISSTDVPDYDERFQQYGYDRISQVCELSMASYRFMILNNAFVVHDGFKFPTKFHAMKDAENKRNFRIYTELFTPEMKRKYPNSTTSCQERNRVRGKAKVQFKPHFKAGMQKVAVSIQQTKEL